MTEQVKIVRYRRIKSRVDSVPERPMDWSREPEWQKGYEFNGREVVDNTGPVVEEVNEHGGWLRNHSVDAVVRV